MKILLALTLFPLTGGCMQMSGPDSLIVNLGPDTTFCAGDSLLLTTGLNADTLIFQWSTGDTTAQLLVFDSGTYSVSVTDSSSTYTDSVVVNVLSSPEVLLRADSVCFGNNITFMASAVHSDEAIYQWDYGDGQSSDTTTNMLLYQYLTPGTYTASLRIEEINGCADSSSASVQVWPLPEVSFTGLDEIYCEQDPVDTLHGVPAGGTFMGAMDLVEEEGLGGFFPEIAGSNIPVIYSFADSLGCLNADTQYVARINPLPLIDFDISSTYCVGDPVDTIYSNTPGAIFSGAWVMDDANIIDEIAVFTPGGVGESEVFLSFTDEEGCSNLIAKSTFVNPLPLVDLGNDTFLISGETLTLSNITSDVDWEYLWSTTATTQDLVVENPGFYVLKITNAVTGCMASDTILVDFASSIDYVLMESLTLFPNPSHDYININLSRHYRDSGYQIFDCEGTLVKRGVLPQGVETHYKISIYDLPVGEYFFVLAEQVWRFIKL